MDSAWRIVIKRPGGYERLAVERVDIRAPGPDEVRIDVRAIGVNYADCVARMGLYASAREFVGYPLTPGFEVAGYVSALGRDVAGPAPGTPVIGVTLFGGYATSICLPARQVFEIPEGLQLAQAAAFPTVFLTAWYALYQLARPAPGARILVHSAAGGVGGALVQLGRRRRGRVIGVVGSAAKLAAVERSGVEAALLADVSLWPTLERMAPEGLDVILDANGGDSLAKGYAHLAPGGRLVVYGFHTMLPKGKGRASWPRLLLSYLRTPRFHPLHMTRHNRSVLAFNLSFMFDQAELLAGGLRDLLAWWAAGELDAPPVQRFAFGDVALAHRALESGTTTGKLVLEVPATGMR